VEQTKCTNTASFTMLMTAFSILVLTIGVATAQGQQQPRPELPRILVSTAYERPSGSVIQVRDGEDLQAALDRARPGDTLALQNGATFTGNFELRPKKGDGWIYIEGSATEDRIRPGQRPSPNDAGYLPRIQTPNSQPAISVLPGAAHYRLVGLEITPAKGAPRTYGLVNIDFITSRVEAKVRDLVQGITPALAPADQFPSNITIDRCYIHGSDTQDVREGVVANGTSVAIIDSYISDIHDSTMDSQAILAYRTPGPIKIVNNFLSATSEDVLFGGAGDTGNPYVSSDIEIRNNHFFKPLSWRASGITLPPNNRWVVKNNLEFKSARRAIVAGNIFENNWLSGQMGYSVVLTVRTSDSGNAAVVDDITIENNILKNVISGFNTLEHDDQCGGAHSRSCSNPGEVKQIRISNNLIMFMDPKGPGGARNWGIALSPDMSDLVFQHNTLVSAPETNCDQSVYFESDPAWKWPPPRSYTHNVWILDNVLCRPPTGDWGEQGMAGLAYYMGDPPPVDKRFLGNVINVPSDGVMHPFPPKNALKSKITFVDPAAANYQLLAPNWMQTSDGTLAGVNMATLQAAVAGVASPIDHKSDDKSSASPPVR